MTDTVKHRLEILQNGGTPDGYTNKWHLMPEGWTDVPLSKIFSSKATKNKGNRFDVVLTNSALHGIIPQSDYFEKEIANQENTEGYYVVHPGDYVYNPRISESAPYGPFNRNDTGLTGIVSPLYTVLVPKKEYADSEFLRYYLESAQWYKYAYSVANYGARFDRMNITSQDFMQMPIAFPPIAEQKKIAEILAQCDRVVALKQERLDEEKRKKQGIVKSIFASNDHNEWTEEPFSSVCTFINGRAYKQEELLKSGKYPVLRVGNLFTKSEWYYSDLELTEDKYIDSGDLIYAWSASFGPQLWEGGKVIYHYHIWKVIPNEKIDKDYLYQYFMYDVELLAKEQQGGTMSHITKQTMENRICRFPSVHKQKQIAHLLAMADQKIELLQTELNEWELKKKALMQLLLTGIVRVKP